ncbi:MAG: hypothetical protein Q9227_001726 [Pyrenula ochraceoflavens]
MGLFKRANDALGINGFTNNSGTTDNHLTTHGSDWYWAVTAVMAVSTAAIIGLAFTIPQRKRLFHYITAAITMVASIAYFSMASNLGWAAIAVEFSRPGNHLVSGNMRQIFYVRYIDWFVTTPLLLLDLLLTAGLPTPTILYTILLDEIMVVTGLIGALVKSSYKFGYFAFGCAAFFGVAYNVVIQGRLHANALSPKVGQTFLICGVWTISLWFLYPIAWGLAEGGNVISSDSEAIFYGILDVLAKPGFAVLLLWGHRNIDPAELGLHIREPGDIANPSTHTANGEKARNGTDGTQTTTTTDNTNNV